MFRPYGAPDNMKLSLPTSAIAVFLCLAAHADPALRLVARGSFDVPAARVGDTVQYRLRVEWRDVPAAVMLLPQSELESPGLRPAGRSATHRVRSGGTAAGEGLNVTEYLYLLVARDAGTARVAPFALRYHNGLNGREESVNVPGTMLKISPALVPFTQRTSVRALAVLIAAAVLAAGLRSALKRRRKRTERSAAAKPESSPFLSEIDALRTRCETADSRAWLTDAERLCTGYLCRRLGVPRTEHVRFEAALDRYLERNQTLPPVAAESWVKLRDLFHEARYAGRRREPHELREACHRMKHCLQYQGEPTP